MAFGGYAFGVKTTPQLTWLPYSGCHHRNGRGLPDLAGAWKPRPYIVLVALIRLGCNFHGPYPVLGRPARLGYDNHASTLSWVPLTG